MGLQAELTAARDVLLALEWCDFVPGTLRKRCPECDAHRDGGVHLPRCALGAECAKARTAETMESVGGYGDIQAARERATAESRARVATETALVDPGPIALNQRTRTLAAGVTRLDERVTVLEHRAGRSQELVDRANGLLDVLRTVDGPAAPWNAAFARWHDARNDALHALAAAGGLQTTHVLDGLVATGRTFDGNSAVLTRESLTEMTDDPELLFADGFDGALLGVATRCGRPPIAVYDRAKCIEILVKDGASPEDAEEHFGFNVEGGWVGERTPAYVTRPTDD